MPPHCDAKDGPVVEGAITALETGDVNEALRFAPEHAQDEIRGAFDRAVEARSAGPAAREVADLFFAETVVRLHRAGEGAPYTGLKPAGLDVGPVIPVAERAIDTGSAEELRWLLSHLLHEEVKERHEHVMNGTEGPGWTRLAHGPGVHRGDAGSSGLVPQAVHDDEGPPRTKVKRSIPRSLAWPASV